MEPIREVLESVAARIRNPFFGYFLFSWAVFNWKAWFYLLFSRANILDRFAFFESDTSPGSLLWWPFLVGFLLAMVSPWVRWFFIWAAEFPTTKGNIVQAEAESKIFERKADLAVVRESLKTVKEESLIAEAERDQKIRAIDDEEARAKLQAQIDEIRQKMDEPVTWDSLRGRESETTNLRLDLVKEGKGFKFKLINIGSAEAKNIKFKLNNIGDDRDPIPKSEYEKFPVPMLSPGGSISLIAAITISSPTTYTAEVSWETLEGKTVNKELFASL